MSRNMLTARGRLFFTSLFRVSIYHSSLKIMSFLINKLFANTLQTVAITFSFLFSLAEFPEPIFP